MTSLICRLYTATMKFRNPLFFRSDHCDAFVVESRWELQLSVSSLISIYLFIYLSRTYHKNIISQPGLLLASSRARQHIQNTCFAITIQSVCFSSMVHTDDHCSLVIRDMGVIRLPDTKVLRAWTNTCLISRPARCGLCYSQALPRGVPTWWRGYKCSQDRLIWDKRFDEEAEVEIKKSSVTETEK